MNEGILGTFEGIDFDVIKKDAIQDGDYIVFHFNPFEVDFEVFNQRMEAAEKAFDKNTIIGLPKGVESLEIFTKESMKDFFEEMLRKLEEN